MGHQAPCFRLFWDFGGLPRVKATVDATLLFQSSVEDIVQIFSDVTDDAEKELHMFDFIEDICADVVGDSEAFAFLRACFASKQAWFCVRRCAWR